MGAFVQDPSSSRFFFSLRFFEGASLLPASPDAVVLPCRHRPRRLEPRPPRPWELPPDTTIGVVPLSTLRLTPSLDGPSYRNGSFSAKAAHSVRYGLILSCNGSLRIPPTALSPQPERISCDIILSRLSIRSRGVDPIKRDDRIAKTYLCSGRQCSIGLPLVEAASDQFMRRDTRLEVGVRVSSTIRCLIQVRVYHGPPFIDLLSLTRLLPRSKQFGNERFKPRHGTFLIPSIIDPPPILQTITCPC